MWKSKIKSNTVIMGMAVGIVLVCTLFMLPLIIILDKIVSRSGRSYEGVGCIYPITGIPTFFKRNKRYIKNAMDER
jgi:hypothetical protein